MIENELCIECRPGLIAFYPVEISVFYLQKVCVDRKVTPLSRRLMVCGPVTMRRHATRFRFNFSNILELISDGIFIRVRRSYITMRCSWSKHSAASLAKASSRRTSRLPNVKAVSTRFWRLLRQRR
jgi:hypothetical protein